MASHSFTVMLDRPPVDQGFDLLFDSGLDDTLPEVADGVGLLHVNRDAASLTDALLGVIADVESAGFSVVGLQEDDLVGLKTIATRVGRSYESARLLASGQRGPGGFPPPISGDGWSLYSWAVVSAWFAENYAQKDDVSEYSRVIAAANHIIRARVILHGHTLGGLAALVA